jgi:hypothetical protein
MNILKKLKETSIITKIKNESVKIDPKQKKLLENEIIFGRLLEDLNDISDIDQEYKKA